ncbi:peptide deformylase [Kaustia mangrovi]|uniref:Peptide deformylase n=1 Tax=Kaustia mangrovi TaxID=2593653 RepID=A0A7S8HD18_9HYPH|nr:peptide deformylase [Kaustia mangrovi]QPC43843.1 peptide deformylase [Kaustia mangrovi]
MAIREIVKIPDPVLKAPSETVPAVTDEVRALLDDMLETMYDAPGIGLAAVQIGVPKRLVVIDLAKEDEEADPLFLINPEIVWASEAESEYEEGCLSIPDVNDVVTRPAEVKVRFLDRDGAEQEMHCDGLLATCVQHEVDHTNGILFIDHLSRLKRERIVKRFAKAKRHGQAAE